MLFWMGFGIGVAAGCVIGAFVTALLLMGAFK